MQLERQPWRRPVIVHPTAARPQSLVLGHLTVAPVLEADLVAAAATVAVTDHRGQRDQLLMPAILTQFQDILLQ